jgi:hypothetical protein
MAQIMVRSPSKFDWVRFVRALVFFKAAYFKAATKRVSYDLGDDTACARGSVAALPVNFDTRPLSISATNTNSVSAT